MTRIRLVLLLALIVTAGCTSGVPKTTIDPLQETLQSTLQAQSQAVLTEDAELLSSIIHPSGVFVRIEFANSTAVAERHYSVADYLLNAEALWNTTEHLKADYTGFQVLLRGETTAIGEAFTLLEYRENTTGKTFRVSARVEYTFSYLGDRWVISKMVMREYRLEEVFI